MAESADYVLQADFHSIRDSGTRTQEFQATYHSGHVGSREQA